MYRWPSKSPRAPEPTTAECTSPVAVTSAADRLDPRHDLFRMAGLRDPVVGADPEAADPLGHADRIGHHDHTEVRQKAGDAVQIGPGVITDAIDVDDNDIQFHRDQLLRGDLGGKLPEAPSGRFDAITQHLDEAGVAVNDGYPQ